MPAARPSPNLPLEASHVVAVAGGVSKLARALGLHHTTVLGWTRVPAERVLQVEAATGISRYRLRPDVFGPAPGTITANPSRPHPEAA